MLTQNDFWYILSTHYMLVITMIIITRKRLCARPGVGRGEGPALAGKIVNQQVSQNDESEFQSDSYKDKE